MKHRAVYKGRELGRGSLKPREFKQCNCGTVVLNICMFIVILNESVHVNYSVFECLPAREC